MKFNPRKNSIVVTNEDLSTLIQMQVKYNQQIENKILQFYKDVRNVEKIRNSVLEEKVLDFIISQISIKNLVITDTIDNGEKTKNVKNIEVLPISGLMGEAIKRISNSTSVSDLFK